MKKIALFLTAVLLLAALPLANAGTEFFFDFEDTANPGFFQSGTCVVTVTGERAYSGQHSLKVGSRGANDWDAADIGWKTLGIQAGDTVAVSFRAYHQGAAAGRISATLAGGSYTVIASADVDPDAWTLLKGEFIMPDTPRDLRFKTDASLAGTDYYIDDVQIGVSRADGESGAFAEYRADFSAGADGWYARSAGTASVSVSDGSLYIKGRSADWNSPGRNFDLTPGSTYNLSVQVMQDEAESISFMISVAHTANGAESYENLARATVKKGEWTEISCRYTAGKFDKFVLYVETSGAPKAAFRIRGFTAEKAKASFDTNIVSLKKFYAEDFDFGCALILPETLDAKRMAFYASQFSIMTHGNELKPDSVLDLAACRKLAAGDDTAVAVRFDKAKPLLDFAQKNGIKIHGHVLVWHSQTPDAFFRAGYDKANDYVSREVMLARLDNYIRLIMEYADANYPGLIVSWDVVNEAIDDKAGKMRESNWTRVAGEDFVLQAFRIARKYAPEDTLLFYNDYSTPYEPKLTGIMKLLDELQAEGNIDGYGFQCHYQLTTPTISQVDNAMEKIAGKGLILRVSELDILIDNNSDGMLLRQAKRYAELFEVFQKYSESIIAVHTWGVCDDLSWKASQYPLMFDAAGQPKYAYYALVDPSRLP